MWRSAIAAAEIGWLLACCGFELKWSTILSTAAPRRRRLASPRPRLLPTWPESRRPGLKNTRRSPGMAGSISRTNKIFTPKNFASGGPLRSGIAPGLPWGGTGLPSARLSRRVGTRHIAGWGQWARSFITCGASPGPLAPTCSKMSSPTRRDTRTHCPAESQYPHTSAVLARRAPCVLVLTVTSSQSRLILSTVVR